MCGIKLLSQKTFASTDRSFRMFVYAVRKYCMFIMYNADASIYKYIYTNLLINTRHGCSEYMLENTTKNQKKKKEPRNFMGKIKITGNYLLCSVRGTNCAFSSLVKHKICGMCRR